MRVESELNGHVRFVNEPGLLAHLGLLLCLGLLGLLGFEYFAPLLLLFSNDHAKGIKVLLLQIVFVIDRVRVGLPFKLHRLGRLFHSGAVRANIAEAFASFSTAAVAAVSGAQIEIAKVVLRALVESSHATELL